MLVDSHCHLDHLNLDDDHSSLSSILDDARERGVTAFLAVGVDLNSSARLIDLAESNRDILVSVGVHPLQETLPALPEPDDLMQMANHPAVVAVGETGLDNYYSPDTSGWQEESFTRHLKVADQLNKPVIVHTRQAQRQTLAILRAHANQEVGGVLHCFTEGWEMAEAAMAMNFYISFSGIITFRNASALREVVRKVPLEKMLVETDAPWLAPVPYRGKQNLPGYVVEVTQMIAEIKGLSYQQVAETTTANFSALFLGGRSLD
ncbi:TatD family hydrolase [Porticoccus sp.]|uniref:TatD family hydrolase n=1 Tax=Porticoccus sp. TaxID=2024853 RepID=UPI003F69CAD6